MRLICHPCKKLFDDDIEGYQTHLATCEAPDGVTEYAILESPNSQALATYVTEALKSGWELYGVPFSVSSLSNAILYQAMIKR